MASDIVYDVETGRIDTVVPPALLREEAASLNPATLHIEHPSWNDARAGRVPSTYRRQRRGLGKRE